MFLGNAANDSLSTSFTKIRLNFRDVQKTGFLKADLLTVYVRDLIANSGAEQHRSSCNNAEHSETFLYGIFKQVFLDLTDFGENDFLRANAACMYFLHFGFYLAESIKNMDFQVW